MESCTSVKLGLMCGTVLCCNFSSPESVRSTGCLPTEKLVSSDCFVVGRRSESAFLSRILSWERKDDIRGDQSAKTDLASYHKLLPSP